MFDKPATRLVILIALLILAAAALRGYFPAHQGSRLSDQGSTRSVLMILGAAIAASLVVVAFSIIARLRDPRVAASSAGELSGMLGGRGAARPSWRVVLIALGVTVAWLLISLLLSRFLTPPDLGIDMPQQEGGSPTSAPGANTPPKKVPRHNDSGDSLGALLATVPILLMLFVGGIFVSRRRRPVPSGTVVTDRGQPTAQADAADSLVRAAEVGLAEMTDLSREPREAIIACYAAMERELANVPGAAPQEFDTPTEVLARAVALGALHADNAGELVNLFEEARFSPHVMNEGHRQTAVRVLELVLAEIAPRSSAV